MNPIDDWRVFVSVGGLKSFVRAARSLGRSPQAVTRRVAALEARLGARLLNRTTRSVSLTSDGERYLERGRRVLAEFDELEAGDDRGAELTGTLSVTAPVMFGQLHVAPVVLAFLAQHRAVSVRLVLLDRNVSLAEEGIDVGVRIGALADSSLQATRVGHVRSVVCASPAYLAARGVPSAPDELTQHECVAFASTTPVADRWAFPGRGGRAKSVHVRPRLVVNSAQAAIDAARAGIGVVRVLSYQAESAVREGALRVVLEGFEPEPVPVQLVRLPGAASRAAQAFSEMAAKRLRGVLAAPLRRRRANGRR